MQTGNIVSSVSMNDNDFLGQHTAVVCNHEEINAVGILFHVVVVVVTIGANGSLEGVNLVAGHVEYLDGGSALHVLEVKVHLAIIGIGYNVDIDRNKSVLVNTQEGRLEVELYRFLTTTVFRHGSQRYIILIAVSHIDPAGAALMVRTQFWFNLP